MCLVSPQHIYIYIYIYIQELTPARCMCCSSRRICSQGWVGDPQNLRHHTTAVDRALRGEPTCKVSSSNCLLYCNRSDNFSILRPSMSSGIHAFKLYVATDVPLSFDSKYETARRHHSSSATVAVAPASSVKLKCNQHLHECVSNTKTAWYGGAFFNDSHRL